MSVIAVGGFLAVSLWTGVVSADKATAPKDAPEQAAQPKPEPSQPKPPPPLIPAEKKSPPPKIEKKEGRSPEYYSEKDLAAQESMADSTQKLVGITENQNWITGIEAGLLLITIFFSGWASIAASKAAKAADRAVEITERAAERQLRAYVMVESANIKKLKIGEIPEVSVTIKNFGQTPAYNVKVWGLPGFQDFPLKGNLPTERPDETDNFVAAPLAPTVPHTIPLIFKRRMNEETIHALKAGSHAIFVVGQVRYIDAFKVERETDFCLFIGGPIGIARGFANYEIGNRAT